MLLIGIVRDGGVYGPDELDRNFGNWRTLRCACYWRWRRLVSTMQWMRGSSLQLILRSAPTEWPFSPRWAIRSTCVVERQYRCPSQPLALLCSSRGCGSFGFSVILRFLWLLLQTLVLTKGPQMAATRRAGCEDHDHMLQEYDGMLGGL